MKIINLQEYENEKVFENVRDEIINVELNDVNLRKLLLALIDFNINYIKAFSKISTLFETHSNSLAKINETLNMAADNFVSQQEMIDKLTEGMSYNNDSLKRALKMINDHTEMFNMVADKLGMS
jgi:hypothetical protein